MGQPEGYIVYKKDMVDDAGQVADESVRKFLQLYMDKFTAWVERHQRLARRIFRSVSRPFAAAGRGSKRNFPLSSGLLRHEHSSPLHTESHHADPSLVAGSAAERSSFVLMLAGVV